MKNREARPIQKHTMNLYAGQFDRFQELFPRIGAAKAIRTLLDDYLRALDERAARSVGPIPESPVSIEEIMPR